MRLFRRARHVVALAALMMSATPFLAVPAQAQARLGDYQVRAAFLYNLAKFVQWPPPADGSDQLVVGVVADDFFSSVLDSLVRGKSVQGREIVVRPLHQEDDLGGYHIVFVGALAARHWSDILLRVGAVGVLTVGETPEFLREGGLVRFYVENRRIRVEINADGANQAGLKINSQLLSLARR